VTPNYRPDIDGLRAIAVLSIVLYHVGIEAFPGGYVGVDIFFVISGFLITSIIVREIDAGEFSIARFYERRVRRILPALIATLVATLGAGLVLAGPAQLVELGKSAAATTVFSSNIFFYLTAGYFDGPSEHKPLLHTWSLAVEEQYYILFPFLMLLIANRFGRRYAPWLVGLAVASFAACVAVTALDATAAFYLIPFRAWELMIGSVLALKLVAPPATRWQRELLAGAGLVMMLAAVFAYTTDTAFPGAAAALPTLGAALVIQAGSGGESVTGRMLSIRPMVFVGLISYSLYLWHWPIVVFAKQVLINQPTDAEVAAMLAAMLLIATLSWRFVEGPFRRRDTFASRERLFAVFATASAVVLAANLAVVGLDGLPDRDTGSDLAAIVVDDPGWQHWKDCEELGEEDPDAPELCAIGADGGAPRFMLWGDSHALAMATAVNLAAKRSGTPGLIAMRTGCPPLAGVDRVGRSSCRGFNDRVLERLATEPAIDTVIVAARWALSVHGTRYKKEEGSTVELAGPDAGPAGPGAGPFEAGLVRTVERLTALGKDVVLVTQVPEVGYDVPSANYIARLTGRDVNLTIAPTRDEYLERNASVNALLGRLAADRPRVRVVDPSLLLCDAARCRVVEDGMPLYRDDNHLSLRGNVLVSGLFDDVLPAAR